MLGVDARPAVAVLAATLLLLWVFAAADYRRRLDHIATALVIGCGIALGWVVTAWGARHAFEPVQLEAGSFVAPVGASPMQLSTHTGVEPGYAVVVGRSVALRVGHRGVYTCSAG